MSRTLRLNSRLLFVCLVIVAVDVSSSYSSKGRRAVHEQGSYLGTEGPRNWKPLYNPYTLSQSHSLSPSQPIPNSVQPDQAQMVFSPRPGVQPGTNNVVTNQREGSPNWKESEPPNSQSSRFPSSSVPSKTVHYYTYPSSGLGSQIVPRTWGASGAFHSVQNPVIQSSHVTTSSLQPAWDIFGSPVERNPIPAQQAENPVSNNEKSKHRKLLSSYLFGGSQPTSSTSETTYKGPSEGVTTVSGLGAISATQIEGNPSVHGYGRSTHFQGGYGYIGSQSYPTSFKYATERPAPMHLPTPSQSASSKVDTNSEAQHASSFTTPFQHSANFAQSGGSPRSYSPGEMVDTQAKSAFSIIQPLIRFGSFWNPIAPTATQPTQRPSEPAERETVPHSPAPDQSLKTKSSYVHWKKPGLTSSSSGQNRGATGSYKPGRSTNVNTLGVFQYQDPETLAPIVSENDIPSVAIRPSINTNTAKSPGTGWRKSHGTSRGMKMGSVSGYPAVYKKYGFAPRIRAASATTSSALSDTLAPRTFKSGPREVQLMSIENNQVSNSLHASSNVQSSSEVQTTTTDMSRSPPRAGRPWFRRYTPSKDNNTKTGHVFKGFQPAPTQLQSPQSESLKLVQPTSSLPSNNDFHDSLTAGEAKPGPTSLAPFKPEARFHMFESVIYRRPKGSRSKQNEGVLGIKLPGETRPSGSHVSAPDEIQPTSITTTASQSQNVPGIVTSQSSDLFHKTVADPFRYEDPKSPPYDLESNEMASNPFRLISGKLSKSQNSYAFMGFQKPISKAGSTLDKDADLGAQIVPPTSDAHPPPVVPTSAPSVHPTPPRVQVQPDPNTTELTESRRPTSSIVKGKRVKGKNMKGQNPLSPSNDNTSPSDTASRPAQPHPMRFKAIQFADILGSASFSGIQPRGGSRHGVQSTSNTTTSGQDGGVLDKAQPTPRGLGSPQVKGGNPKAVSLLPFNSDAAQSEEGYVGSVIGGVQSGGSGLK